ncbi:hypothetical protein FACS189429_7560 [Bacteroidia bacterium]|nr:hypothetical protein FACS189429_7560 [Bacteroidia bacterium]GHV44279.1 hypothetical protein FACS1894180_5450 [Bacteroidia bacterium]
MKHLVKFSTVMLLAALVFAGCKKDEPKEDYAPKIVGTYTGTVIMGENPVMSDAILAVARVSDNKVTLSIADTPVGDVNAEATVTKSGDKYAVAGTTSIQMGVSIPVTISGDFTEQGAVNLTIEVPNFASMKFTGAKQVAK